MDVSGVRSSCEMSARNACSLARARSISPAISLNAPPSSRISCGPPIGTRARWSVANARTPPTSRRSGRVIVRASSPATSRAKPAEMSPATTSDGNSAGITSAYTARGRATTMNPWPPAPSDAVRSCCWAKIQPSPFVSVNWPMPVASGCGSRVFINVPSLSMSTRRWALFGCGLLPGLRMSSGAFAAWTCSAIARTASRGACPFFTAVWIAVWNGAASSWSRMRVTSFSYLKRRPPIASPATAMPTRTTARYERNSRPMMLRNALTSRRRDELVPDPPDRLDLRARPVQLVAQLLHVDVDRARLAGVGEAPHVLEQLVARQDDAGLPAERLEELEFLCPQRDRASVDGHLVPRGVEQEVADGQRLGPCAPGHASQHRVHAGNELAGVERLGEVVVEPGIETRDLLHVLRARGERDDG